MSELRKYTAKEIETIGSRVRAQRELKHISQRILGEKINVKKDVIQRLESGNLKNINERLITEIAYHLDCDVKYLLLQSNKSLNPHILDVKNYRQLPEYQHTAEGFVYANSQLRSDLAYISEYMHEEYQKQLIELIHTFTMFHKIGVHYPDVSPEEASSKKKLDLFKESENNFFEREKKQSSMSKKEQ